MKRFLLLFLTFLLTLSLWSCKIEGDFGFPPPAEQTGNTPKETVSEGAETEIPEGPVADPDAVTFERISGIIGAEYKTPKNVILLIGDGMGPNDVVLAEKYGDGVYDFGLLLNMITNNGLVTTKSADNEITDSAAAGTALATGTKTNNGFVGVAPDSTVLKNMAEIAREAGKKVGIVTDDELFGATPSAFLAHSESRYNYEELAADILDFAPEVIIGSSFDNYFAKLAEDRKNEFENRYNVAKDQAEFESVSALGEENGKMFAGFNGGYKDAVSDHLAISAETALNLLDGEEGFFLMIEGCGTDMYGHENNISGKIAGVVNLDKTLEKILLFMEQNPDTLLIVTSDHETGGVGLPEGEAEPTNELFTATAHTGTDVRVFALGMGSEAFNGVTVDNVDIAKHMIGVLTGAGVGETEQTS